MELGGGLPCLTVYRAIIISLVLYFVFISEFPVKGEEIPVLGILVLVLIAKGISLILAYNFREALKDFLGFAFEIVLFYVILFKALADKDTLFSVVKAVCYATLIMAAIGFIEYYTHFNPIDYISLRGHPRFNPENAYAVYSTLSHPIHLGTALVMGWPICLYVLDQQHSVAKKRLIWVCLLLLYASLYFARSRGPWLAFILAAMVLVLFRYPGIKAKALAIIVITGLVLVLRPGVYDSIRGLSAASFNPYENEGSSVYYRFELFKKAYKEVTKSQERLAFGYGDGAAHSMNLRDEVSYGSGRMSRFWSWDSEFALILLQQGFVGLVLNVILYSSCLLYMMKAARCTEEIECSVVTALLASNFVLVFMMTNVAIFAPSLHLIFWTNFALVASLLRKNTQMNHQKNKMVSRS